MSEVDRRKTTRQLFKIYPDYELARNLTDNIALGIKTWGQAEELLWSKLRDAHQNRQAIEEKLDERKIRSGQQWRRIKDLTFRQIAELEDPIFEEVLKFYLKHPYAHGRVSRPAFHKPRILRTLFLRSLIGHAMKRRLDLNFGEMFELLSWL